MKDIDFVKFYVDNFINRPLRTKSDIHIYKLVHDGHDNGDWYSDDVLDQLFNGSMHKNPALIFVYKLCRDNKSLFVKEVIVK